MDNIVWNRPMIVLNNIVIMPDTSSHLDVISKESCEAVANAMKGDCSILLVTAKEVKENAKAPDLYPIGVTAKIKQYLKMPNKTVRILIEAEKRARIVSFYKEDGAYNADFEYIDTEETNHLDAAEEETLSRMLTDKLRQAFANGMGTNKLLYKRLLTIDDLAKFADGPRPHTSRTPPAVPCGAQRGWVGHLLPAGCWKLPAAARRQSSSPPQNISTSAG